MEIHNVEFKSFWNYKIPIIALSFYFLIILPFTQLYLKTYPWFYKYTDVLYFSLIIIITIYRFNFLDLGFSTKYLKQHLLIGFALGGALLITIEFLNYGMNYISSSGYMITESDLVKNSLFNWENLWNKTFILLFIPIIEQIFFTGFVLQALIKKINPIIAIYLVSLIFTSTGFDLSLGTFGLGMFTGLLFKLTGTLYSSILIQISCALAKEIIINLHPKLLVIFQFLF